jgi:hypothetical protein
MDQASPALAQELDPDLHRTQPASIESIVPRTTAWYRRKGRPSRKTKAEEQQYLTPLEEKALVTHLLRMAALGTPIRIKFIPPLAFSLARRRSPTKAIKPPNKNWPQAFTRRHPELKSRRTRAMDWNRHDNNIYDKVTQWFEVIEPELHGADVKPENVYNMDETGVMLSMLNSVTVLLGKHDEHDYRGAGVKRTMVTAVECISASGECLKPMIIWPASTHRSNWTTYDTPGWVYAFSESGYTDSYLTLQWLQKVFDPQTKARANGKLRILICDGFGTHETLEILEFCFENNIILCRLPSHTSHKLQPCDVAAFGPLKTAYRDEVERLYRSGVTIVNKEHFTSLYSPARAKALTKKNILAGWAKSGLFPFNPDRVLRDITKPLVLSSDRTVCKDLEQCLEDELVQTPVTPVSTEGLASLLDQIRQAPHDEASKQQHKKLVQKLGNAAQTSFAQQTLDQDHIHFLTKMNNEAKTRRSTKSAILGKARVMTFEDLEAARTKRAEKEAAKEAKGKAKSGRKPKSVPAETRKATTKKGKRGRKSKSVVSEPEPEPELEPQQTRNAPMQTSGTNVTEATAVDSWKAPVARMW